jgi:hypothetical protein
MIIPELNRIIVDDHHGFRPSKSTTTNLLTLQHSIIDAFSAGLRMDVIYTDFAKAFDKVNHIIFLYKLKYIGVCDPLLRWIESYISQRTQIVVYKEIQSKPILVTSGVPRGSHLAPILFLIYINEITFLNSSKLMFADDIKIYRVVNCLDDTALLQSDLNMLFNWCNKHCITLNIQKCQVMTFSRSRSNHFFNYHINGTPLSTIINVIKDLGVLFEPKLIFNAHIRYIYDNKALKLLGFISGSCVDFNNKNAFISIYYSLVRSIFEYCSII